MQVIVTTCPKYQHLVPGFKERFEKHWGGEFTLDVAREGESWSAQMRRVAEGVEDTHFVRMCEDFWMYEDAKIGLIQLLFGFAKSNNIDRIGLQGRDEGYQECSDPYDGFGDMFRLRNSAEYLCSFEASIYSRDFLLRVLPENKHIWESEIICSNTARKDEPTVLVSKDKLVFYKDATRRGQSRVEGMPDIV